MANILFDTATATVEKRGGGEAVFNALWGTLVTTGPQLVATHLLQEYQEDHPNEKRCTCHLLTAKSTSFANIADRLSTLAEATNETATYSRVQELKDIIKTMLASGLIITHAGIKELIGESPEQGDVVKEITEMQGSESVRAEDKISRRSTDNSCLDYRHGHWMWVHCSHH